MIIRFWRHYRELSRYLDKCIIRTHNPGNSLSINYIGSLEFEGHTSSTTYKSRRPLGFIIKTFLAMEIKLTLLKMCIRHSIEYCPFIFTKISTIYKVWVESTQRSCIYRLLGCDSTLDCTARCTHLSSGPLWCRYLRNALVFFCNIICGLSSLTSSTP